MDRLEYVLRGTASSLTGECLPFGVRRVKAAGDPLQLSAFGVTGTSVEVCAFQTRSWHDAFVSYHGSTIALSHQHRQNHADLLWPLLMRVRVGAVTDEDIFLLKATWAGGADDYPDYQHLRAVNADVDAYNNNRLARLAGDAVLFKAVDSVLVQHLERRKYAAQRIQKLAREVLWIKVGAEKV
ncbi:hypothetical protein I4F81_004594 [Pyropia yezoensis]|uniref:Uncharacterized protein n=1 Tax=Pyropia yezoensis TaxID=2788 RepID=A0ACC3BWN2_PYRYE|nr:hypothetical protein I4F81_004594 [Neopyropia yezoensis]